MSALRYTVRSCTIPLAVMITMATLSSLHADDMDARVDVVATSVTESTLGGTRERNDHAYRATQWPLRDDSLTLHVTSEDGQDAAVSLPGLKPISFKMLCQAELGTRISCGARARAEIINFLSGKPIVCRKRGEEIVACAVEGKDLADWLVRAGIAVPNEADRHADAMSEAHDARRGLWADARMRNKIAPSLTRRDARAG